MFTRATSEGTNIHITLDQELTIRWDSTSFDSEPAFFVDRALDIDDDLQPSESYTRDRVSWYGFSVN